MNTLERITTLIKVGAIINLVSFDRNKNPHAVSIFEEGLWGFSKRYRKRWNLLDEGTRVLIYGDKGIHMACYVLNKYESSEPVKYWTISGKKGSGKYGVYGYPFQVKLRLLNKTIENIKPIDREELLDKYEVGLAKQGFRGVGLTIFGDKEQKGITYSIEKFNKIWNRFVTTNNLEKIEEITPEKEFLLKRINELERQMRKKDEMIKSFLVPTALMTDEKLGQLTPHDQLIYKLGIILDAVGFNDIQLDLTSKMPTPPFGMEHKESYKVRDKEYDVKGDYEKRLFVVEVHDKGILIQTLVKLNELRSAKKGLLLVNLEDERELKKELKRPQFKDLLYELKVFYENEINELYRFCKVFFALRNEIEMKKRKIDEMTASLKEKRSTILDKPPYIEKIF